VIGEWWGANTDWWRENRSREVGRLASGDQDGGQNFGVPGGFEVVFR